jgi:hypothetical protein
MGNKCEEGQIKLQIGRVKLSIICSERANGTKSHKWVEIMIQEGQLDTKIRNENNWYQFDQVERFRPEQLVKFMTEILKQEILYKQSVHDYRKY